MISWIWLIPALMAGAMFGIFAVALVNGGRRDDQHEVGCSCDFAARIFRGGFHGRIRRGTGVQK